MIDWKSITTDELLELIPETEDNRWEHKADQLVIDSLKFKIEMGKQVSAFANSGGGYIVLGLNTKREWHPLPDQKNNGITMKDYLAAVVSNAVEYPLQGARIHPIKFTDPKPAPAQFAYVIEIPDSPAAPHQARDEQIYYWRIDGHSKRSPHFYLELLRNRFTKSILRVTKADFAIHEIIEEEVTQECSLEMCLKIEVVNESMLSAQSWGVQITQTTPFVDTKQITDFNRWFGNSDLLASGVHFHSERPSALLPGERCRIDAVVNAYTGYSAAAVFLELWRKFGVTIRPVSHNHVGEPFEYGNWDDDDTFRLVQHQFIGMVNPALQATTFIKDFEEVRRNRRNK